MSEATRILQAVQQGNQGAADELLPLVYDELRQLAAVHLAREKPGQTLQPTALVHEAYLRLVGPGNIEGFANRRHFFGAAAEAMRRILVENARRKGRNKHGGGKQQVSIPLENVVESGAEEDLLLLHDVLEQFATIEPQKAKLVELHFFGGLTLEQAALCLDISLSSANRHWRYARAWLYSAMAGENLKSTDSPDTF